MKSRDLLTLALAAARAVGVSGGVFADWPSPIPGWAAFPPVMTNWAGKATLTKSRSRSTSISFCMPP